MAVSIVPSSFFSPAVSVATTAASTITLWPTSDTKPRPNAPFLFVLRLDSIRWSNTAVSSGLVDLVAK